MGPSSKNMLACNAKEFKTISVWLYLGSCMGFEISITDGIDIDIFIKPLFNTISSSMIVLKRVTITLINI